MGAGGSVAQELVSPRIHGISRAHHQRSSTTGQHYREMLDHLRNQFTAEVEVLRSKYGEVDQDALIVRLLMEEFSFTTVEVNDLPALRMQPREKDKVYLLGETNFQQASACVEVASLKPKALEMAGDEMLSAVAREALPANSKTSKKAVELMGSTKVVTEKKALKRLGSEMTESMRALQLKTERKEQREEESRPKGNRPPSMPDLVGEGGGDVVGVCSSPRIASPNNTMARRATRLLTEVPKFISEMGMGGGSKVDLSKVT